MAILCNISTDFFTVYVLMIYHTPVLVQAILGSIDTAFRLILDATFGHGGHSIAIVNKFPQVRIFGIDIDKQMLQKAQSRIATLPIILQHGNYADSITLCKKYFFVPVDYILLDLGVNRDHFFDSQRGFSIHANAKLDMRFDTSNPCAASEFLKNIQLEQLASIFRTYGDFSASLSYRIAQAIKQHNNIDTTGLLVDILRKYGLSRKKLPVAFQAIRMAVNQELQNLENFLGGLDILLAPKGRCAIISYHSVEDRIVKNAFKTYVQTGAYMLYTKKVIKPSWDEIQRNRSARSAKLRILQKL